MDADLHPLIDLLSSLLEIAGVAVIVGGAVLATFIFIAELVKTRDGTKAYDGYRANLGRGILLGLELLVGADIIATITAPLTFESVGLLGLVVLIRTFLSLSLETEIEGAWPWRRREAGGEPRRGQPNA